MRAPPLWFNRNEILTEQVYVGALMYKTFTEEEGNQETRGRSKVNQSSKCNLRGGAREARNSKMPVAESSTEAAGWQTGSVPLQASPLGYLAALRPDCGLCGRRHASRGWSLSLQHRPRIHYP